jgi:histidinol phosphatase-like PHP family hydrolase
LASLAKAKMVVDTDTHAPDDLIDRERAKQIAMGAGLTREEAAMIVEHHAILG